MTGIFGLVRDFRIYRTKMISRCVCWYRSKQTDDKSVNFLDVGIAHVHPRISTNPIIMIALTGLAVHCIAESLTPASA
jgi:hypothetical protein